MDYLLTIRSLVRIVIFMNGEMTQVGKRNAKPAKLAPAWEIIVIAGQPAAYTDEFGTFVIARNTNWK